MFKSGHFIPMIMFQLILGLFLSFFLLSTSVADSETLDATPQQLQEWVPWVTKDDPEFGCPTLVNQSHKICAYPSTLTLNINQNNGTFSQSWRVYNASLIPLPGDAANWPLQVQVNEHRHSVIEYKGAPYVYLKAGHYRIDGIFKWYQQPKHIAVPDQTGLLNLIVDGEAIKVPDFRNGKLWFKSTESRQHENNRLQLQVFRKISDTIPLQIQTQLHIDVSGKQREVVLTGVLLQDFIPAALSSQLPAQLDQQGNLKIQVRPGQWVLNITARNPKQLSTIPLPEYPSPWPQQEIWVLDSKPHLRQINVTGRHSIDANQTRLPPQWKKYPAFQMKSGESLSFEVIKRGDPEGEPDQLKLVKKIWLDFDGQGFTVNDTITGKLSRQWRLNTSSEVELGQVTINGQPQYITHNKDNTLRGVEVRHGELTLSADSRLPESRTFSAGGWDVDFKSVSSRLYLPAGWKLFSLSGAEASTTWIAQWTLLDLFLVLITAIAMYKLWGIRWGLAGLMALVLIWHEGIAPQVIWINLIVAIAVLKVLPESRFARVVQGYRLLMSVVLVLIILPFIVDQARTALYPQLEFNNRQFGEYAQSISGRGDTSLTSYSVDALEKSRGLSSYAPAKQAKIDLQKDMARIDPDAMIQTGPGLPSWTLGEHHIRWDGPVKSSQTISMILLSPPINAFLNVLRILLVIIMAWRLMGYTSLQLPSVSGLKTTKMLLPVVWVTSALMTSFVIGGQLAEAAYPSRALLDELQKTLNKPEKCQPSCAMIESLSVDLKKDFLTLRLTILSQTEQSVPLPVPLKKWQPNRIEIEGEESALAFRHNQQLWLHLKKGTHQVSVTGAIDYLNHLQLQFPLKPHFIDVSATGWSTEGWDNDINKINALSFSRIESNDQTLTQEQSDIPVHVEIQRNLNLGVDWQVTTQVKVLAGTSFPAIVKVPLLAGESVLSDGIKVQDGRVLVTMSQQKQHVSWVSKLAIAEELNLTAIDSKLATEKWILNVSPMWRVAYEGIPVIYHQRHGAQWQPQWHPWANEQVTLKIRRPEGVKGNTVTIDSSHLTIKPGEQITTASIEFNLRSSLGGQHIVTLPEQSELQQVSINGKALPIRQTERGVSLPITPGQQKIVINWQQPNGIGINYQTPVIDLGIESVNNAITLEPGYNRWVLLTHGPKMGPAVLFWGIFGVILLISYGLGRMKGVPLNTLQWLLLWTGLSASLPATMALIAGTLIVLSKRGTMKTEQLSDATFNLMQVGLVVLMVLSVFALIGSIQEGLLGSPAMQIAGNGSSSYQLNWFSDRITSQLPIATLWSVPVYLYRILMLLWSIWLAFAFIKWVKWAWQAFTHGGGWRQIKMKPRVKQQKKTKKSEELTINDSDIEFK